MDLERLWEIANWLEGTITSIQQAIDHFELDVTEDELEDRLLDVNMEICSGCGWWMLSGELVDEMGVVVGCEQCREKNEEEEDGEEDC